MPKYKSKQNTSPHPPTHPTEGGEGDPRVSQYSTVNLPQHADAVRKTTHFEWVPVVQAAAKINNSLADDPLHN